MQALLLLVLISFIAGVIGAMAAILSQSAMIDKLDKVEQTKEIFADIEFVLNQSILLNNADLTSFDSAFDVETMLQDQSVFPESTSWTTAELTTDAWAVRHDVRFATDDIAINGNVIAPAVAIALISPGPDRQLQTTIPAQAALDGQPGATSYRDVLRIEAAEGSDDIIHTFSTIDAARQTWNFAYSKVQKAASLALFDYRQKLENFSEVVEEYYRLNGDEIYSGDFEITDTLVNAWIHGSGAAAPIDPSASPNYFGLVADYPAMPSTLAEFGADLEVESITPGMAVTIEQPGCTNDPLDCKVVTLRVVEFPDNTATEWQIFYRLKLDGESTGN